MKSEYKERTSWDSIDPNSMIGTVEHIYASAAEALSTMPYTCDCDTPALIPCYTARSRTEPRYRTFHWWCRNCCWRTNNLRHYGDEKIAF